MDVAQAASEGQTPARTSALTPAILALAAPVSVIVALEASGDVLAAFATYHVAFCLTVPLVALRMAGYDGQAMVTHLGLRWPSARGLSAGAAAGLLMGAGLAAPAFTFARRILLDAPLQETLTAWGVSPGYTAVLLVYMIVVNSGTEELFWRGYLQTEAIGRLGRRLGIGLVSLAFTSYHVYTIYALLGRWELAFLGGLGVAFAAVVWALLRERYASLVPALLAHGGATAGYMLVYLSIV